MNYGHEHQSWMRCRVVTQLVVVLLIGLFVFTYALSNIYLPYLDAKKLRTESVEHARQHIAVVCTNPATMKQLGRHGLADCAEYEKTVLIDVDYEASIDVLRRFNFCDGGNCMVLSFNAITLLTVFLPWTLVAFVVLLLVTVGCIGYKGYYALQRNYEMPMSQMLAVAELMSQQHRHAAIGKQC